MSGALPIRGQLARLDRLVGSHEMYWAAVAQQNPRSTVMRDFFRKHWDPWFTDWTERRYRLDKRRSVIDETGRLSEQLVPASDAVVADLVRHGAQGLSQMRQIAADSRIPTPDLGTSQHGVTPDDMNVAGVAVGDLFGDIFGAIKGAAKSVASFVHHPPGWFATIFPLMTMENQRYWARKFGGSTGEKLYDEGVKAIAAKYLGPQGPALVETYNKVTEDAAQGNLNAREILAKAPEIAKLAAASKQGPDALRAALAETKSTPKISGDEGERHMSDGHSYPEVAARAVQQTHAQTPSPIYGYFRLGMQQKIYLFPAIEDARGWMTALVHSEQPYDYAAVFAATDLSRPVSESFGHMSVSGDAYVGNWWPFFLGLPLGGLGGYFLRRWQEQNPGQALPGVPPGKLPAPQIPPTAIAPPKTSGDPYVGGPWVDMVGPQVGGPWVDMVGPQVGGPWVDMVGPQVGGPWLDVEQVGGPWVDMVGPQVGGPWLDVEQVGLQYGSTDAERRRLWPQTKALIQSAISDVTSYEASHPAEAFVWTLDAPSAPSYAGRVPGSIIMLEGTTNIVPFSSQSAALQYLREVAQTRPVALAMFERSSRHWPNPVAWRKSDEPEAEQIIAQHVASRSTTQTSGAYVGAEIGSALDEVRRRAQTLAEKRAGHVIGVIHTSKDKLWHTLAFRSEDDADDWIETATQDPKGYTYAAYFNKDDERFWPHAVIEKVSGMRSPPGTALPRKTVASVGADARSALEQLRRHAKDLATSHTPAGSGAAGVIKTADGLWHALGFNTLDDSVDWLQAATREKTSFTYAAIFEKASDGSAYFQDEEIGERRTPPQTAETIHRGIATTSGDGYSWGA